MATVVTNTIVNIPVKQPIGVRKIEYSFDELKVNAIIWKDDGTIVTATGDIPTFVAGTGAITMTLTAN